jgi:hypothetical protein
MAPTCSASSRSSSKRASARMPSGKCARARSRSRARATASSVPPTLSRAAWATSAALAGSATAPCVRGAGDWPSSALSPAVSRGARSPDARAGLLPTQPPPRSRAARRVVGRAADGTARCGWTSNLRGEAGPASSEGGHPPRDARRTSFVAPRALASCRDARRASGRRRDDAAQRHCDRRGPPPAPRLGHVRWKPPRVHRRVCVARRARGVRVARACGVPTSEAACGDARACGSGQTPACSSLGHRAVLPVGTTVCVHGRADQRGACRRACACRPARRTQCAVARVRRSRATPASSLAWATCGALPVCTGVYVCVCVRGRGRGRGRGHVACPPAPRKRRAATRVRRAEAGNPPPAPHGQRAVLPVGTGVCVCVCAWACRPAWRAKAPTRSCSARSCSARSCSARSCSARRRAAACGERGGRRTAPRASPLSSSHSFFGCGSCGCMWVYFRKSCDFLVGGAVTVETGRGVVVGRIFKAWGSCGCMWVYFRKCCDFLVGGDLTVET